MDYRLPHPDQPIMEQLIGMTDTAFLGRGAKSNWESSAIAGYTIWLFYDGIRIQYRCTNPDCPS